MMVIKYNRLISGDVINFNYVKWVKSKIPFAFLRQHMPLVAIVSASFILLILTRLFTSNIEYDLGQSLMRELNFGVIVDCGSSGTRAHIFKWKKEDHQIAQIELFRDLHNGKALTKHITPGLSSIRDEPDKASEYMEPIMDFISKTIPSEKHLDTPIYFMATAGLRLLEDSTRKKILSDITRDIRAKFDFPKIKSQVITGEYEGIYSWLSLNVRKIYNDSDDFKSYGMIEMGGASAQVTYELNPEIENSILKNLKRTDAITTFRKEQVTLNLGHNQSVKLFASSFLGLGVNSVREFAIDLLVRDYLNGTGELGAKQLPKDFEVSLKDPCLTMESSEIVLRPIESISRLEQSVGFLIKRPDETFKVKLEGSGNFLNCLNLLERVLQVVKAERLNCAPSKQYCPMALLGSDFIPYQHYSFIGLSEMFFTTNEMINSAGVFNRTKILHETNSICSTKYSRLLEMYSHKEVSHQDRILYECFKASWLLTMLHNSGFKMPVTYNNFITAERLDGREIDWTLGAMIHEIVLNKRP